MKHKNTLQQGFTFVELLIIMIVVAILSGFGIQFVLSTQEDKAKLTNAKSFILKDIPMAINSCQLRKSSIVSCGDSANLIAENIDSKTEWGQDWILSELIFIPFFNSPTESIALCYPLSAAGKDADSIGESLVNYLKDEWSGKVDTVNYYSGIPSFTTATLLSTFVLPFSAANLINDCSQKALIVEFIPRKP